MSESRNQRSTFLVVLFAVGRAAAFVLQIGMTVIGAGPKGNAPLLPPQPTSPRPPEYRP